MSILTASQTRITSGKTMKQYRYLIYHLRWQVSAIVMMPVLYLLDRFDLALWASLMLSQCFGAFIFWYIDLFIFSDGRSAKQKGMR